MYDQKIVNVGPALQNNKKMWAKRIVAIETFSPGKIAVYKIFEGTNEKI